MKVQKVKSINIGSFNSFLWDTSLTDFNNKINVLLGWNGAGKTILSRIFRCFELGEVDKKLEGSSFSLEIDNQSRNQDNLSGFDNEIRVFNEDYIEKILAQSHLDYVIAVGESKVDFSEKEKEKQEAEKELKLIRCINEHDTIAHDVALDVIKPIAGIGHIRKELESGMYNAYNTRSFVKRIDRIKEELENNSRKIEDFIKGEEDIDRLRKSLSNQSKKEEEFNILKKCNDWIFELDKNGKSNLEKINSILEFIPTYEPSDRISKFQDWSEEGKWIREGVKIHNLNNSETTLDKCLFCDSDIENKDELLKHFSEDIIRLTQALDSYEQKTDDSLKKINSVTSFYLEEKQKLKEFYEDLKKKISKKKNSKSQKEEESDFNDLFSKEEETSDLSRTAWEIETHYVAQKYETYVSKKSAFEECQNKMKLLEKKLKGIEDELKVLKEKVKNVHIPKENLNNLLKIAFPYRKILLDDYGDTGYVLSRNGTKCNLSDLSEGERNFLALAYFLISINTKEEGKQISQDGVVVIDDPVSSLDSDSLFHIYSILLGEIDTHHERQYFILTHNLDFFGHLLKRYKRGQENLDNFYQLVFNSSGSIITELHNRLCSYNSDYRYAISKLEELKKSNDINDQIFAANLLRRALETFLHFKYGAGDLLSKIEQAYNSFTDIFMERMAQADDTAKEAKRREITGKREMLYRYINYGSHEFLGIDKIDMSALQHSNDVINDFFELIEKIDKEHYKTFKLN